MTRLKRPGTLKPGKTPKSTNRLVLKKASSRHMASSALETSGIRKRAVKPKSPLRTQIEHALEVGSETVVGSVVTKPEQDAMADSLKVAAQVLSALDLKVVQPGDEHLIDELVGKTKPQ